MPRFMALHMMSQVCWIVGDNVLRIWKSYIEGAETVHRSPNVLPHDEACTGYEKLLK